MNMLDFNFYHGVRTELYGLTNSVQLREILNFNSVVKMSYRKISVFDISNQTFFQESR